MKIFSLFVLFFITYNAINAQMMSIPFLNNHNTTIEYADLIPFYENLAAEYPDISKLQIIGTTDSGKPLHVFKISSDPDFSPEQERAAGKLILFINNGIHPGEPCGISAAMLWSQSVLASANEALLDSIAIYIIPVYNVGGMLNRNSTSRANQIGPESYGFRGNARNYDLNRDFIKLDSKNARSWVSFYSRCKPHIFLDTHTSNGSDYQYVITLIATQRDKANPIIADYLSEEMIPELYAGMEAGNYPMIPYVYSYERTPDKGIKAFLDLPRYSTGYAALFNALPFMTETHMLKPYKDRVKSTQLFMDVLLEFAMENTTEIIANKAKADAYDRQLNTWHYQWQLDTSRDSTLLFKGYRPKYKPSEITGAERLYYDHEEPFAEEIPYYLHYKSMAEATKPEQYIIPQSRYDIAQLLELNNVDVDTLEEDRLIRCRFYKFAAYESLDRAYEGHYLHSETRLKAIEKPVEFQAGDYLVSTDQASVRFIMHVLEPEAEDSYFNWNYFDAILQRKEHFSPYVFEGLAASYLDEHPAFKKEFEATRAASAEMQENPYKQLHWIYAHGPWSEESYLLYPIGKVME